MGLLGADNRRSIGNSETSEILEIFQKFLRPESKSNLRNP